MRAVFGPRKSTYPSIKSKNGKSVITDPDEVFNYPSDFYSSVLEDILQWETNHKLAEQPTPYSD